MVSPSYVGQPLQLTYFGFQLSDSFLSTHIRSPLPRIFASILQPGASAATRLHPIALQLSRSTWVTGERGGQMSADVPVFWRVIRLAAIRFHVRVDAPPTMNVRKLAADVV